ncbi:RluA family pseudouridine synthase [Palleronia rufa]|uniref:RluA family pseudouridine synthase n=1 Tax=Palleronia rufa TaxID=1530186 RepID=UPI00056B04CE|nr:RluA family pseudouridine synthase [Palleronia rufa]
MSGVHMRRVAAGEGDQRLDRWFRRHYPHVPQGRIEKMCRKGEIRVDGARARGATRLDEGQEVRIPPLPDGAAPQPQRGATEVSAADARMIRDAVIFRDDHIIALNKPPGLPTQGGSKQTRHVDQLSDALRFGLEDRPRLVHRLDKDTSGILLLARTRAAAKGLAEALRHRATRKIYWAAVAGVPQPRSGTIKYGLVKAPGHGRSGEGEKMICLHPDAVRDTPDAKRAETDFTVISGLGGRVSWCALEPITGRTHQLRAHMAELGHPIVGDGKYGGSGQQNEGDGWGAQLGGDMSKKLHLHARSMRFEHPVTRAAMTLTAPLPEHMARTWAALEWAPADAADDPFAPDP